MTPIILDFETYYDKDITLKKMNYSEYTAATTPLLVATIHNQKLTCTDQIAKHLAQIDWPHTILVGHNLLFDALILKHFYGHEAARYIDTLGMARLLFPSIKHDLFSLAERFCPHLPKKKESLAAIKGKHLKDLTDIEKNHLIAYCKHDVLITAHLYGQFIDEIPELELDLIDHTIKTFINPTLVLDTEKASAALNQEREEINQLLIKNELSKELIRSDAKFYDHLVSLSYTPPTKWSSKQNKEIPAFAKNDGAFQEFYSHNPELQELLDLKRTVNSNIKESRTTRLINAATINNGKIPVGYNYCGAFTGRFCLTGDTTISVLRNQEILDIILPELLPSDLVWDGDNFVSHGGLIDQGIHEVISYDGITGTPDHRVFVNEIDAPIELRKAMERNYPLKIANPPPKLPTHLTNPTS